MADTSSTSAGKLTIGVQVDSSGVAAGVADAAQKAEEAASKSSSIASKLAAGIQGAHNAILNPAEALRNMVAALPVVGKIAVFVGEIVMSYAVWKQHADHVKRVSKETGDEYARIFAQFAKQDFTKNGLTESVAQLDGLKEKYRQIFEQIYNDQKLLEPERQKQLAKMYDQERDETIALRRIIAVQSEAFEKGAKDRARVYGEKVTKEELLRENDARKEAAMQTDNEYAKIELRRFDRNEKLYKKLDAADVQGQIDSINRQIQLSNEQAQRETALQRAEDDRRARAARNEAEQRRTAEDAATKQIRDAQLAAIEQVRKAQMQGFEASGSTVFGAGAIPDLLRAIQYQGSVRQE